MEKKERVTVYIYETSWDKLKKINEEYGVPLSKLVNDSIDNSAHILEKKYPLWITMSEKPEKKELYNNSSGFNAYRQLNYI